MLGEPPQRVQAADAHVQLVAAKLVDGSAELFREVPFMRDAQRVLAHAQLPPRGVGTEEEDHAGDGLQKRGADVVDRGKSVCRRDVSCAEVVVDHHRG